MTKNRKRGMIGVELDEWIATQRHIDSNGCWIWNLTQSHGYGIVRIDGKMVGVHQYSLERKIGRKLLPGEVTRHVCPNAPNRKCHNPDHLELGMQRDNVRDTVNAGRQSKGEDHSISIGKSKLTKEQICLIRSQRGIKSGKDLAQEYGVSSAQISRIQLNQQWSHVHQHTSNS